MLDQTLIKEVVGCTFTHDFKEIVLTQLETEAPEIRKGPGTISYDEDGRLRLKLFLTHDLDLQVIADRWNAPSVAGKLLEGSAFYRLKATDYKGQVWTCEKTKPQDSIWMDTGGGTVTAELAYIETTDKTFLPVKEHNLYFVVPFTPSLPYEMEERNERYTRTKFTMALKGETTLSVFERENHILIHAQSQNPVDEPLVLLAIEAVSIATGESLRSAYKLSRSPDVEVTRLSWISRRKRTILGPFNHIERPTEFKGFVEQYLQLCDEVPNNFFGYWEKALHAWQSGLTIAALPLAVYIEGVANELFPNLKKEKAEIVAAVEAMEKHMNSAAGIDPEIIKRCVKSVQSIKGKSAQTALKSLASEGWFDPGLIGTWRDVRNKSAHGNDMTKDQERDKVQSVIDGVFGCLHLFYALLLVRMKFEGEIVNYSAHGFPKMRLKPAKAPSQ